MDVAQKINPVALVLAVLIAPPVEIVVNVITVLAEEPVVYVHQKY